MAETVNIVFICDEGYVMPTFAAITSLITNKRKDTYYSVHILVNNVSLSSKKRFESLKNDRVEIEVIDCLPIKNLESYNKANLHVSATALYKFSISEIFDYDKILYLDSDIIVRGDLTELYETDISNVYAAVVKNYLLNTQLRDFSHSKYFNSGVMLLNLRKFREDDLFHKLWNYRKKYKGRFQDQDTFNVVLGGNVIYISFFYNVQSVMMWRLTINELCTHYGFDKSIITKDDIYSKAVILHLNSQYKPWIYSNIPFADEWMFYYKHSDFGEEPERKILDHEIFRSIFRSIYLSRENWNITNEVVVSLTSYPDRIIYAAEVVRTLLDQTVRVDRILLYLAKEEFSGLEQDLPQELAEIAKKYGNFEIRWVDYNLKPHKKYYYAMQEFPDSIIITVDDDVIYPNNLVESLLDSYVIYPYAVSCTNARLIAFEEDGSIAPYIKWRHETDKTGIPSQAFLAIGVGGILYPPGSLSKEAFNSEKIKDTCLLTDDLWLKIMEVMNNTPVVIANSYNIKYYEGSQENALSKKNLVLNENDVQLRKILDVYDQYYGEKDTLLKRIRRAVRRSAIYLNKLEALQDDIESIRNSLSYRVGRFITYVPRKIRGLVRCCKEHGMRYTFRRILVHLHLKKY